MMMKTASRARFVTGALGAVAFGTAFFVTSAVQAPRPAAEFDNFEALGPSRHVVAIFVASSTCGASEFPGLHEALRDIRYTLGARARDGETRFVSVGVALDDDPWRGTEFLKTFGPFDEVLAGGSWLNTGAITFMLRDWPSPRTIPQLVLVERAVAGTELSVLSVTDRVVGRKIGAEAIVNYARTLSRNDDRGEPSGVRTP